MTSGECNAGRHRDCVAGLGRGRRSHWRRRLLVRMHVVDCTAAVTQRGAGHHAAAAARYVGDRCTMAK